MMPSRFLLMMASSDESTMAARCRRASTARRASLTSRKTRTTAALLLLRQPGFAGAGLGRLAGGLLLEEAPGVFLGLPPFGHVPGDFGVAAQHAVGVPQGRDEDAGPEARAVLAHAPALFLVLAG